MHRAISTGFAGLCLAAVLRLRAGQMLLQVDSTTSSVTASLKLKTALASSTSTDSTPVSGFLLLDLDTNGVPHALSSRHFDMHGVEPLHFQNWVITWISMLDTTASDLQFFDAFPGPQALYVPLTGGAFASTNKWFLTRGTATFSGATSGTMNLNLSEPMLLTGATGTFQSSGGMNSVHMDFAFAFTQITISNTPLGTVTVDLFGSSSLNARAAVDAPPPPAPILDIELPVPTNCLALRWPSALWPSAVPTNTPAGYWPWRTSNLVEAAWAREPAPIRDDGTNAVAIPPLDAPARFYRLEWR